MNCECQIADFADRSVSAGIEKDQISYLADIRVRIGRSDCNARDPKAFEIIDIVSNVGDLFQGQPAGRRQTSQCLALVANSLLNGESELQAACRHHRVGFGR